MLQPPIQIGTRAEYKAHSKYAWSWLIMANKNHLRKNCIEPPHNDELCGKVTTMHVTTNGERYGVQAKGYKKEKTSSTRNTPKWWALRKCKIKKHMETNAQWHYNKLSSRVAWNPSLISAWWEVPSTNSIMENNPHYGLLQKKTILDSHLQVRNQ